MTYDIYGRMPDMAGGDAGRKTFADGLRLAATCKTTENGANAFNATGSAVTDLFATIGGMRSGDGSMERLGAMIDAAWAEDPLLTMRCIFYARDARGGLGEREIGRKALYHCAMAHADALRKNLERVPEYGRWDDMFSLIGTPLEDDMWSIIRTQLETDTAEAERGGKVSLLAKWMPSADTSSKRTVALAKYAAQRLGMNVYAYKRYVRALRRHLRLLEQDMTANRWSEIDYGHLPSQAHMRHIKAFNRHDAERYGQYICDLRAGNAKVNASTLFPYEILERLSRDPVANTPLEEMWRNLPDYVGDGDNVLVVADTSGSMAGRPMATSVSLAIYFAERNTGPFGGLYMTFSEKPQLIEVKGDTLQQKAEQMYNGPWGRNTNLYAVFDFLLYIAVKLECPPEELPKSIVIITDMEIDSCESIGAAMWETIVDKVDAAYRAKGYRMPNLVFWNVASRQSTFLGRSDRRGVQMVSGSSASVFKAVLGFADGMTPVEAVRQVLDSDRYSDITV